MKRLKRLLGFNSPYSWAKWLIIGGVLIFVFFIVFAIVEEHVYPLGGILLFISDYGQDILLYMLIATGGCAVGSVVISLIKQVFSLIKTLKSGQPEMRVFAVWRTIIMFLNFLLPLAIILTIAGQVIEDNNIFSVYGKFPILANLSGVEYETYRLIYYAVCLSVIFALWITGFFLNRRYTNNFKEQIVKKGFESVFDNVDYQPKKSLDENDVRASGMHDYNLFKGNDYLSAEYNGKHFIQSDIHLQKETVEQVCGSDGKYHTKRTRTTIFKGLFMIFDYDAISNERVAVYNKEVNSPKSKIETEFDAFNKRFYISAADATEAFRILTPQVIEGIAEAGERLECSLNLVFVNDKLYVAVSNGNSFEANSYGNDTFTKQLARVRGDVQTVLDIIQILYLKK